jgi:uncharacterized protein (DUF433 family)
MKRVAIGEHLVVEPQVCHGQLTFKGTRAPVETILGRLAKGRTIESILTGWPELPREAVAEALQLAAQALIDQTGARAPYEPVRPPRAIGRARLARRPRKRVEIGEYLVVDPRMCHGQLTFKGTRVPVSTVLTFMAMGWTIEQVLESWAYLPREGIMEAIRLASAALVDTSTARAEGRATTPKPGAKTRRTKAPQRSSERDNEPAHPG